MAASVVSINNQMRHSVQTSDTFQNFAARTGIGTGNISDANTYGFNPISRIRQLIEWMYRGSWLCGVGVDCVADDMTRDMISINSTLKPDQIEQLETAWRLKQISQSLNLVVKWARLYGGALGYIDIEGQDPSSQLRLETIAKGQFKGVVAMDMWMVMPDLVNTIKEAGPNFGLPEYYTPIAISWNFPLQQVKIHHSRLIRMEGLELPYFQKLSENMWGISVLERVWDRLTAFDSTTQGAAQLAYRAYLRTLKIEGLRKLISTGGKPYDAMIQGVELMRRYQANEGVSLLDASDTFETHQYTFAGLSDLLNSMGEQIAGALQIPITRLFGQAPGGLNASSDHDLRTYYDNIKRLQERWFRRPIDVLLRVLAANEGITVPNGFNYSFRPLWQMTDKEKAEVNAADTNAVVSIQATGIVPSAVLLKELRERGRTTGYWTNITDEDIADAEEADQMPMPSELGDNGGPEFTPEEQMENAKAKQIGDALPSRRGR